MSRPPIPAKYDPRDTKQQRAVLRQNWAARRTRQLFPAGTRVTTGVMEGTVERHVPHTNAQGGVLIIKWDNGVTGRVGPIVVKRVEQARDQDAYRPPSRAGLWPGSDA